MYFVSKWFSIKKKTTSFLLLIFHHFANMPVSLSQNALLERILMIQLKIVND